MSDIPVNNIVIDPANHEAEQVEKSFEDIQTAMRLGLIAKHEVTRTFEPLKPAFRTYTFVVFDEHFEKLTEAESKGMMGRTDPDV